MLEWRQCSNAMSARKSRWAVARSRVAECTGRGGEVQVAGGEAGALALTSTHARFISDDEDDGQAAC